MSSKSSADAPNDGDVTTLLEEVQTRVEELEQLCQLVNELDVRRTNYESRAGDEDPEQIQQLWQPGLEKLQTFLAQPIQLRAGEEPVSLRHAVDTFRHWTDTFRSNAAGPGGEPLHESRPRLEKFLLKLTGLEPSLETLLGRAQTLQADPSTDQDAITQHADQLRTQLEADAGRQAAIDAAVADLHARYGERIATLRARATEQAEALGRLADTTNSPQLTAQARAGQKAYAALAVEELEQNLRTLTEWVDRFRADPRLTGQSIQDRVEVDVAQSLLKRETQLQVIDAQFDPTQLQAAEEKRRSASREALQNQLNQHLDRVRQRAQALVTLRRRKLGSEPDDRFFGSVAKEVNDAISALGEQENRLLELRTFALSPFTPGVNGPSHTGSVPESAKVRNRIQTNQQAVAKILQKTALFVDPVKLEDRLAQAAQAAAQAHALELAKQAHERRQDSQQRAARHQQAAASEVAQARLTQRIEALTTHQETLLGQLREALGYAAAVEPFETTSALALYRQLDAALAAPVTLPDLTATSVATVLTTPLTDSFTQARTSDSSTLSEATVTGLEILLGPAGRLVETLTTVLHTMQMQPLSEYRAAELAQARRTAKHHQLRALLEQVDEQLLTRRQEQVTGTVQEVKGMIDQLETDTQRLQSTRHVLGSSPTDQTLSEAEATLTTLAARYARATSQSTPDPDQLEAERLRERLQGYLRTPRPAAVANTQTKLAAPSPQGIQIQVRHAQNG